MLRLRILTLISTVLAIVIFLHNYKTRSTHTIASELPRQRIYEDTVATHCPPGDLRPPDQTFLTFPEWFLVHSPAEQADWFNAHTATTFPYSGHIAQFWGSYHLMYKQIAHRYPFNTGYHVMICVIGVSTTVEYGFKSWYETIAGRATAAPGLTEEDRFNADYTKDYVDFIRVSPWYEFDFSHQLKQLWSEVSLLGEHPLRKVERRYLLTTELLTKWSYGWLIRQATRSAYEIALPTTIVETDRAPVSFNGKVLQHLPDSTVVLELPRYEAFKTAAAQVANEGINFRTIAGNRSEILLTILTRSDAHPALPAGCRVLFTQDILTRPGIQRVAVTVIVAGLSPLLRFLEQSHIPVEHIYDY
ncbi:hypothetical protein [Chitinophaga vietnamensis]|uniref:hypothetical protein n=1 Tax=Chitinophaga vietnamensis TaxID=2593957 RepID=UPI0011788906|nr:hypothetical protein [Chitinophaga vietnamensis]